MGKQRPSLREGKLYLDGNCVMDAIKAEFFFAPEVSESRAIGQKGKSRRWIGRDVTGNISEYKSTPWLKEAVKKYEETGKTPQFTLVGVNDDPNSDYGATYGNDVVTLESVVLTSEIPLIQLDSEGEHVICDYEFGAENVIIG
ncbi:phage tail tube protein [Anaerovorax sp. IOR16]|uniref:phage tail tube protein n=1 Tax=Anaerovorax sp. IOR16 TaxID=2773458 RepID=UPI0019D08165|nr:phage tail tube protein [Anaerovorax sp. IOR16]